MGTSGRRRTKELEELFRRTEARLEAEDEEYRQMGIEIKRLQLENAKLEVQAAARDAAAQEAEADWQRALLRRKNARMLRSADALHGPGLIEQLEEKWTDMSPYPQISKLERWARWSVLVKEHADELTSVLVDNEQLVPPEVLPSLVTVLQNLEAKCERKAGPFNDRIWIYADQLGEQDAKVLMALCKCYEVTFTYVHNGRISKSSAQNLQINSTEWGAIFDI